MAAGKSRRLGSGVAHKNVELAKACLHLSKHIGNLLWTGHVRLHQKTIGAAFTNVCQRLLGGRLAFQDLAI
jgi:hypothetical protein